MTSAPRLTHRRTIRRPAISVGGGSTRSIHRDSASKSISDGSRPGDVMGGSGSTTTEPGRTRGSGEATPGDGSSPLHRSMERLDARRDRASLQSYRFRFKAADRYQGVVTAPRRRWPESVVSASTVWAGTDVRPGWQAIRIVRELSPSCDDGVEGIGARGSVSMGRHHRPGSHKRWT